MSECIIVAAGKNKFLQALTMTRPKKTDMYAISHFCKYAKHADIMWVAFKFIEEVGI